jgi:hypothetical protein
MKLKDIVSESLTEFGTISEASLSRLVSMVQNKDFCIATAFRSNFTKKQNRQRNKELFNMLQGKKMGGYMLVGHWQEAPDGTDWKDASPESTPREEFTKMCVDIAKKFNQDAVIIGLQGEGVHLYFKNGDSTKIGTDFSIGKIAQAYSNLRGGNPTPFMFEGSLIPETNFGRMAFSINNILYKK